MSLAEICVFQPPRPPPGPPCATASAMRSRVRSGSDAALVKDNHVVAAGGVAAAFEKVRSMFPGLPVEVEVDSLGQLTEVLAAGETAGAFRRGADPVQL